MPRTAGCRARASAQPRRSAPFASRISSTHEARRRTPTDAGGGRGAEPERPPEQVEHESRFGRRLESGAVREPHPPPRAIPSRHHAGEDQAPRQTRDDGRRWLVGRVHHARPACRHDGRGVPARSERATDQSRAVRALGCRQRPVLLPPQAEEGGSPAPGHHRSEGLQELLGRRVLVADMRRQGPGPPVPTGAPRPWTASGSRYQTI